jgi:hypothetical protein
MAFEDADPPIWQQWGYESMQNFMDSNGLATEEDYYNYIADYVQYWKEDQELQQRWEQWRDEYLAAHPDYLQSLLDRSPALWEESYYGSKEDYMYWNGLETEEDYENYLLEWYLYPEFEKTLEAERIARERVAMGGPAEGVGVMWAGEYVAFPDAGPEIREGRTMVPVRAFMELCGADVVYDQDSRSVSLTLPDGRELSFAIGATTVEVTENTEVRTTELDVPPYLKDDRSYVPLRFFSEALGYDVFWDSDFQTAVVLDRASVVNAVDEEFSVLNRVLAGVERNEQKTYETTGSISADLCMFDSLDGDQTARVTGSYTALTRDDSVDMSGSIDLSALAALMQEDYPDNLPEDAAALLQPTTYDLLYNLEEGLLYIRSPLLAASYDIPDGAWMSIEVPTDEIVAAEPITMGALLYESCCSDSSGVYSLTNLYDAAGEAAAEIGDGCFTENDEYWELKYGVDEIGLIFEELTGLASEGMKDTSFKLRVNKTNGYSGSFEMTIDDFYTVRLELSLQETRYRSSSNLYVHIKNMFSLNLSSSSSTAISIETLRTAPPAGATVISGDDLYGEEYDPFIELALLKALGI